MTRTFLGAQVASVQKFKVVPAPLGIHFNKRMNAMKFSVPQHALVAVVDGEKATFFTNTAPTGIKLEHAENYAPDADDRSGAPPLPPETSQSDKDEAKFASHVAHALYDRAHKRGVKAFVLIADPRTLGQIRPALHEEVSKHITGELAKTLTNATVEEIEKSLTAAIKN